MVLPEGTGGTKPKAKLNPATAWMAGVLIVAGLAGLSALTQPDPKTEAGGSTVPVTIVTPTTIPAWAPLVRGDPIEFSQAGSRDSLPPIETVVFDGRTVVFFPARATAERGVAGLTMASLPLGSRWAATDIPVEFEIQAIVAGDTHLLAAGAHVIDGTVAAWVSPDGLAWTELDLPQEGEGDDWYVLGDATVIMPNLYVITAYSYEEPWRANLEPLLLEHLGLEEIGAPWHLEYDRVVIEGPLGMVAAVVELEDLGLEPEDFEDQFLLENPELVTWVSDDSGATWTANSWTETWPETVVTLPGGDVGMITHGNGGPQMALLDPSAMEWNPSIAWQGQVWDIQQWQSGLTSRSQLGERISISSDGTNWENLDPLAMVDEPGQTWLEALAGNGHGLVVAATTEDSEMEDVELEPFRLEGDGVVLTFDEDAGTFVLSRQGEVLISTAVWDRTPEQYLVFDFVERTVTFVDPDTGDDLASFTYDEIEREQFARYRAASSGRSRTILTSHDALTWRVGRIEARYGESWVRDIDLVDDRLVVTLVGSSPQTVSGFPLVHVEVWEASLSG